MKIDEWGYVEKQINRSKIKRYPYKKILGMSLTNYILNCRRDGLNSAETFGKLLLEKNIAIYEFQNPFEVKKFRDNIWTSICARFSEENSRFKIR